MPQTQTAIYVYTAILNQTGTADPVATVMHNTFPSTTVITWDRFGVGEYQCNIGSVTEDNTVVFSTGNSTSPFIWSFPDAGGVTVENHDINGNLIDVMQQVTIEIRQYNNI